MRSLLIAVLVAVYCAALTGIGTAQTKQRVDFAPGSSSAEVKGSIRGYGYRDYIVRAAAGQSGHIRLKAANRFTVLTVFLPNGENLEGAAEVNEYNGELPAAGDYVVRVGMMRAEARRRNSAVKYLLRVSIR